MGKTRWWGDRLIDGGLKQLLGQENDRNLREICPDDAGRLKELSWSWCWLRERRRKRKQTVRPERARNVDTNRLLNDEKRCKTDWDMRLTFWCRVGWGGLWCWSWFSTTKSPIRTILGALGRYDRIVFSVKSREDDVQWILIYRSKTKKRVFPSQKSHISGTAERSRAHEGSKRSHW